MWRFTLAAVVTGAVGCGEAKGVPLTHEAAQADCELLCVREAKCSAADRGGDCVDECADELGSGYRTDAMGDVAACVDDLDCSSSMARCLIECTPTPAHEKFETLCRAKIALCDGNGDLCETTPSPTNPEIGFACLYTSSVMQSLQKCLQRPCAVLEECFADVLSSAGLGEQTHFPP